MDSSKVLSSMESHIKQYSRLLEMKKEHLNRIASDDTESVILSDIAELGVRYMKRMEGILEKLREVELKRIPEKKTDKLIKHLLAESAKSSYLSKPTQFNDGDTKFFEGRITTINEVIYILMEDDEE